MQSTTIIIHKYIAVRQSQDIFYFNIKKKKYWNCSLSGLLHKKSQRSAANIFTAGRPNSITGIMCAGGQF